MTEQVLQTQHIFTESAHLTSAPVPVRYLKITTMT